MEPSEVIDLSAIKKVIRRLKYSMGIMGIAIHAVLTNLFFNAPDIQTNTAHNKAGLYAALIGILLLAAIIETGMWLIDKSQEIKGENK